MSTPETGFTQGASGPENVYDTTPTGLGLSPSYLASSFASATASGGGGGSLPSGSVSLFAGTAAPTGWVSCNGAAYDGTDPLYAALFGAIGNTYGGAGIGAFNVPDLRGRVAVGLGSNAAVSALGMSDGQAVANRRPQHRTTDAKTVGVGSLTLPAHTHDIAAAGGGSDSAGTLGAANQFATSGGGGGGGNPHTANPTTAPAINGTPTLGGSIGTNVGTDALDAPSYIVLLYIISL